MRRHRFILLLTTLLAAFGSGAQPADRLFATAFEAYPGLCVAGELGGDTLPAPPLAGAELLGCFEIRNDDAQRVSEHASGSLPLPRSVGVADSDLERLVVIGPGGRRWPAELRVISRWGRPLADTSAPVRWLQISLSVSIEASAAPRLALLRLPTAPPPSDQRALTVTGTASLRSVDTGLAIFVVDPSHIQPIREIQIRELPGAQALTVFSAADGSSDEGWSIRARDAEGGQLLEAGTAIPGSIVIEASHWDAATGPNEAIAQVQGWFEAVGNTAASFCAGNLARPRLPFSLQLSFRRGSRDVDFAWQVGNACGEPQSAAADGLLTIDHLAFRLPLGRADDAAVVPMVGYLDAPIEQRPDDTTRLLALRQHRGGGVPWTRQARFSRDALPLHDAEYHTAPVVGMHRNLATLGEQRLVALAQMPWLRFREPQGLATFGGRLDFELVSEPIRVGKLKSLWFAGRLSLDLIPTNQIELHAERMRRQGRAALERGLVLRSLPMFLDAAQVLPPLGGTLAHAPGQAYLNFLERKHQDTVGEEPCTLAAADQGSQWTCSKTFGLQLWPDVQFEGRFGYVDNPSPIENEGKLNYWDPAHIELVEFLRSGDPRWLWEFAHPQAQLMAYTVYYNFGRYPGGTMDGHVFGNGGIGDGLWHRNGNGSADWTYNRHQALAYLLRPGSAQRQHFEQAGQAAALRFVNDPNDELTWPAIGRGNLQYIESLANCAQFVAGDAGNHCDQRLRQVMTWLIENSLTAGLMCERKRLAGPECFVGQFFMLYAWYYPILDRLYLNYAHTYPAALEQIWRRALTETPGHVLASLPRSADGTVDVDAVWPNGLLCTLGGADFDQVLGCSALFAENLSENKPATLSLLARGEAYGATLCPDLVEIGRSLFPGPDPLGFLRFVVRGGWFKDAAEAGQELSTAALGVGRCLP